jgi:hypothetical protein
MGVSKHCMESLPAVAIYTVWKYSKYLALNLACMNSFFF